MKASTRTRATPAPVLASPHDSDEVLDRVRAAFDTLTPELRRAARWMSVSVSGFCSLAHSNIVRLASAQRNWRQNSSRWLATTR